MPPCCAAHATAADARARAPQFLELALSLREPCGEGAFDLATFISQDKSELAISKFLLILNTCMKQYTGVRCAGARVGAYTRADARCPPQAAGWTAPTGSRTTTRRCATRSSS